ncbi:MAG: hypothetical protein IKN89_09360, partial [Oscillospiraceae bacterium]|nr:hypothetical protein [Oscillospiraceae bacterium]
MLNVSLPTLNLLGNSRLLFRVTIAAPTQGRLLPWLPRGGSCQPPSPARRMTDEGWPAWRALARSAR